MTLIWGAGYSVGGDQKFDLSVKTSAYLTIRPREPRALSDLLGELRKATTLLAFIAGSPMAPDLIWAKLDNDAHEVQVLLKLTEPETCAFKSEQEFFMLRDHMQVSLNDVFVKWYREYDTVEMPSKLALSVLCAKGGWPHVQFLGVMQALEGFHRSQNDGRYVVDPEKYRLIEETIINAIPVSVDRDHKNALMARIKYGNEISLRKRLDELVKSLDKDVSKIIFWRDGKIPNRCVDIRNYYTHWDESLRLELGECLDGVKVLQATVRMKLFLRAICLGLVGIPSEKIESALCSKTNSESRYLAHLNVIESKAKV